MKIRASARYFNVTVMCADRKYVLQIAQVIVLALTLRYLTEFGKTAFQHITVSTRIELIDIVVRVRCRRKESSRPLSISSPDELLVHY